MYKRLVGGPGLFAACRAVTVDQSCWEYRGSILDVLASTTAGSHYRGGSSTVLEGVLKMLLYLGSI